LRTRRCQTIETVTLGRRQSGGSDPRVAAGSENPYATLGIIEAYIKLGRNAEAEALRSQLLARKNTAWGSTAIPIARCRGLPRRT
jgi:hypothetical protein